MTRSPDQVRRVNAAVADVERYWYVDTQTKEIRRRRRQGVLKLLDFVWPHKHKVLELYWWIAENWASGDLIIFDFPMTHDNMPLEGFPMKFELQGKWTIPFGDIKFLTDGPLASEGLNRILVPANLGWRHVLELGKQLAPLFTIGTGLVGLVVNYPLLKRAFISITNVT